VKWKAQQWWAGANVVIIGGGDSLRSFDWRRLMPFMTIGCNDAYQLGPSVCTVCIFGDLNWYHRHCSRGLKEFPNPVFTNQPSLYIKSPDWVLAMAREKTGVANDGESLGWGGNTGFAAVNLALYLGARRVFLLGFDMKRSEDGERRSNWHDHNVGKPNDASYKRFSDQFKKHGKQFFEKFPGREIVNLGPDSNMNTFPKMKLDEIIPIIETKEAVPA